MKTGHAVACAAIIICMCQTGWAREWQISPFVGYSFGDGSFEEEQSGTELTLREATSYGFAVNMQDEKDTQYEFYYSLQPTELKVDDGILSDDALSDIDVHYIQIGGTVMLSDEKYFARPFIVGTLGVTHFNPRSSGFDTLTRPSLGLGIGALVPLFSHVGVRLEGRGFATLVNTSGAIFSNDQGLSIRLKSDTFTQFVFNAGFFISF